MPGSKILKYFGLASALAGWDVPMLMTNIPTSLGQLTGIFAGDRTAFIFLLDDPGAERNAGYALKQMYIVVDRR